MIQSKVFPYEHCSLLEGVINEWLNKNQGIKIITTTQTQSFTGEPSRVTLTIFYETYSEPYDNSKGMFERTGPN